MADNRSATRKTTFQMSEPVGLVSSWIRPKPEAHGESQVEPNTQSQGDRDCQAFVFIQISGVCRRCLLAQPSLDPATVVHSIGG